jgi:large subunit ribosomal protein L3
VGAVIKADVFAEGEKVDVSGISKGHGFTGAIYRWNQHTGPMKHGSKYHRGLGSMGANSDPSRVFPGKKMAGHMGSERVTVLNLDVVKVDGELGVIAVRGAVPGPKGNIITIRDSVINV